MADACSVAAFAALWSTVAVQLVLAHPPARLLALTLIALPVTVLAADFASGLVHWFADRYFDSRTPLLGPMLIEPFREHHRDPTAMTHHDFLEVSGNNGLVTLPLAIVLLARGADAQDTIAWQLAWVGVLLFALLIFATNQIHAWAHAQSVPRWVRRLQAARLVLSPAAHARHHEGAYDRSYCITTGWLNGPLDAVGAFERIERTLARLGLDVTTSGGDHTKAGQEDPAEEETDVTP